MTFLLSHGARIHRRNRMIFSNTGIHTNTTLFLFPSDDAMTDAFPEDIYLDEKSLWFQEEIIQPTLSFWTLLLH